MDVTGLSRAKLLALGQFELTPDQEAQIETWISRRNDYEPMAYIRGWTEFYSLRLVINHCTLVPRPETELLVKWAIEHIPPNAAVIDVGTGSGAIAVALKTARPDLVVVASDNSAAALEVAQQNIDHHQLDITLIEADLLHTIPATDSVVANLPYLPTTHPPDPSVRKEPQQALLGGSDGLDHYRRLFDQLKTRAETKQVIIEAEPAQHQTLTKIARLTGYQSSKHRDYVLHFVRGS